MPHHLRLAAAILCCVGGIAQAQTQPPQPNTTGNAFYSICTPQNPLYVHCVFYVIGYTDGLNLANGILQAERMQPMFCMPSSGSRTLLGSVTGVQSIDIVMNFLQRNPQRRHELTAVLVVEAFKEAFPCRG